MINYITFQFLVVCTNWHMQEISTGHVKIKYSFFVEETSWINFSRSIRYFLSPQSGCYPSWCHHDMRTLSTLLTLLHGNLLIPGMKGQQPRWQSSWGQHGAHLGPVGYRWAPCWPHEPCYRGVQCFHVFVANLINPLNKQSNGQWNGMP